MAKIASPMLIDQALAERALMVAICAVHEPWGGVRPEPEIFQLPMPCA
jgi:hypothetical protein